MFLFKKLKLQVLFTEHEYVDYSTSKEGKQSLFNVGCCGMKNPWYFN